jgi:hypothetical protein
MSWLYNHTEVEPGTIWRRHIDQLRDSEIDENNIEEPEIVLPSVNIPSTTVTDITVNDIHISSGMSWLYNHTEGLLCL